ncbi:MAG: hypothetical protein ACI89J_000319 [Hyphomicrobiaceae bacterium]|jgi:hypothetical protein
MRIASTSLIALFALTISCFPLVTSSFAQAPILQPSLDLSPEDVVSIQLKALSDSENDPRTNSGIARVWAFAHPANRAVTGPLARFTMMLQSPNYKALISHRAHHMRQISLTEDKAHFAIKITSNGGDLLGYSWQLGKAKTGKYQGMWMTTGVSLVGKLGKAL